MGTVVSFPDVGRAARGGRPIADRFESATVIILPVIRIERYTDERSGSLRRPEERSTPRRRRRRRATRS